MVCADGVKFVVHIQLRKAKAVVRKGYLQPCVYCGVRKVTDGLAIYLETLQEVYQPGGLLDSIAIRTIGAVMGQLCEVFRFKRSKEDLLEILDVDGTIALMKTKEGFLTFRMRKGDHWAIPLLRVGTRNRRIAMTMTATATM